MRPPEFSKFISIDLEDDVILLEEGLHYTKYLPNSKELVISIDQIKCLIYDIREGDQNEMP